MGEPMGHGGIGWQAMAKANSWNWGTEIHLAESYFKLFYKALWSTCDWITWNCNHLWGLNGKHVSCWKENADAKLELLYWNEVLLTRLCAWLSTSNNLTSKIMFGKRIWFAKMPRLEIDDSLCGDMWWFKAIILLLLMLGKVIGCEFGWCFNIFQGWKARPSWVLSQINTISTFPVASSLESMSSLSMAQGWDLQGIHESLPGVPCWSRIDLCNWAQQSEWPTWWHLPQTVDMNKDIWNFFLAKFCRVGETNITVRSRMTQ